MKNDTQHLEFLISQYVDGTLDGASRKTIEQQLLTDATAKALYKEHRDAQDLLDDWGNRLPLINWNEFDAKLADRLEAECPAAPAAAAPWRKWARPAAVAAALLIAVGTGYAFRAMQGGQEIAHKDPLPPQAVPEMRVAVERPTVGGAGRMSVDVRENVPTRQVAEGKVEVHPDPFFEIDRARKLGGWPVLTPRPTMTAGASLPETQPGAVRAEAEPATRPESEDKVLQ